MPCRLNIELGDRLTEERGVVCEELCRLGGDVGADRKGERGLRNTTTALRLGLVRERPHGVGVD